MLPHDILSIAQLIEDRGGKVYVVGGWVRDRLLGLPSGDIDIEIFGITVDKLHALLGIFGKVDAVGKSFGVLKLTTRTGTYDFSLPRMDSKIGVGHKEFRTEFNPAMNISLAAMRRDFTVNALSYALPEMELVDPTGSGQEDLANGILRHVSPQFAEDPLRVLRAFRFVSRFGFQVAPETIEMCRELMTEYQFLPKERIWNEWERWSHGKHPDLGLQFLADCGWICFYPELHLMIGLEQDDKHHPEGDVWTHTKMVCRAMVHHCNMGGVLGEHRTMLMLTALLHDCGKYRTTQKVDGKITTYGHQQEGSWISEIFLSRIGAPHRFAERVSPLVREHMAHVFMKQVTPRGVRRLALRLKPATIQDWIALVYSDQAGRGHNSGKLPKAAREIMWESKRLNVTDKGPEPIMMGRHLLGIIKPGPEMGELLETAFQAQLDGAFKTVSEGLQFIGGLL